MNKIPSLDDFYARTGCFEDFDGEASQGYASGGWRLPHGGDVPGDLDAQFLYGGELPLGPQMGEQAEFHPLPVEVPVVVEDMDLDLDPLSLEGGIHPDVSDGHV